MLRRIMTHPMFQTLKQTKLYLEAYAPKHPCDGCEHETGTGRDDHCTVFYPEEKYPEPCWESYYFDSSGQQECKDWYAEVYHTKPKSAEEVEAYNVTKYGYDEIPF